MQIIEKEHLLSYGKYENLATLPVSSTHKVTAIGFVSHYGTQRLVIKIGDTFYQAGQDLESNVAKLKQNCTVKIEKVRINRSARSKYAICSIYEPGDWTAHVDYAKTLILARRDGSTCVVDVKTVDIKGIKRKLLLTDNGSVYKLKKSKLEDSVQPGFL